MKIGLAGAGRIGARHAAALCQLPEVTALHIVDTDHGRVRAVAVRLPRETRVVAMDAVGDLFSSGLNGLVVAAANDCHTQLEEQPIAARIAVFCEKPLASDL